MITHLSVRKFQSWRRADVELAGITVITGDNRAGKSALLRALKYAVTNKGGEDFIRHGAARCEVAITLDDNRVVSWTKERGKGGTYHLYEPPYEDATFTKTGTTVPPAIVEATGIRPLEVEKGSVIWPQLRLQFDPPFLVTESGTRVARILGKLTKLDVLVTGQMRAKRDRDSSQREADVLSRQYDNVKDKLMGMKNIEALREFYDEVEGTVLYAQLRAQAAAKARHATERMRLHTTAKRRQLQDFLQAERAVNELQWRARKARSAARDYLRALDAREAASAPISCCK